MRNNLRALPAGSVRRGEEGGALVLLRLLEPHVPQPLLVQGLEDEQEERANDPDGEADEDEHDIAHVEGARVADAELLVDVELDVIGSVESPVGLGGNHVANWQLTFRPVEVQYSI